MKKKIKKSASSFSYDPSLGQLLKERSFPNTIDINPQPQKTYMPVIAGILLIIMGLISLIGFVIILSIHFSNFGIPTGDFSVIFIIVSIIRILIISVLFFGAYHSIKRVKYSWTIGAAILFLIFNSPIFYEVEGDLLLEFLQRAVFIVIGFTILGLLIHSRQEFENPGFLFKSGQEKQTNNYLLKEHSIGPVTTKRPWKSKSIIIISLIICVSLAFVSIGLITGLFNDDDEFINKAKTIVDDLYPVNKNNLSSAYSKAKIYEKEIGDYDLSSLSHYEITRDHLNKAFNYIEKAYNTNDWQQQFIYIDRANIHLEYVILDLD